MFDFHHVLHVRLFRLLGPTIALRRVSDMVGHSDISSSTGYEP